MWNKIDKKYIYIGIVVLTIIFIMAIAFTLLSNWRNVMEVISIFNSAMMPVYIGFVIAYLLNPLVKRVEGAIFYPLAKKIAKKESLQKSLARGISIFVVLAASAFLIIELCMLVLPELVNSINLLILDLPSYYRSFRVWLDEFSKNNPKLLYYVMGVTDQAYQQIMSWLKTDLLPTSSELILNVSNGIINTVNILFNIFIGVIFSIYMMANKEVFSAQAKRIIYTLLHKKQAKKVLELMSETHTTFGKFISGKLLDSLIVGILTFLVLTIAGIPYTILISVLIGVTNIIPFFGQYIGCVPSAVLVFLVDPTKGVIFLILNIIIMQVDGNIIGPKIMGESIGLGSFWVLFSILIFGSLFGLFGMIVAVPVFSILFRMIKRWSASRLEKKQLPIETKFYMNSNEEEN